MPFKKGHIKHGGQKPEGLPRAKWNSGFPCPKCSTRMFVGTSCAHWNANANVLVRRRICTNPECKFSVATHEHIADFSVLTVIKRDGSYEPFSNEKIVAGLMKACHKRNITEARIHRIAENIKDIIANTIQRRLDGEGLTTKKSMNVTSTMIGKLCLDTLKHLDSVSYFRYATVFYKCLTMEDMVNLVIAMQNDGIDASAEPIPPKYPQSKAIK